MSPAAHQKLDRVGSKVQDELGRNSDSPTDSGRSQVRTGNVCLDTRNIAVGQRQLDHRLGPPYAETKGPRVPNWRFSSLRGSMNADVSCIWRSGSAARGKISSQEKNEG